MMRTGLAMIFFFAPFLADLFGGRTGREGFLGFFDLAMERTLLSGCESRETLKKATMTGKRARWTHGCVVARKVATQGSCHDGTERNTAARTSPAVRLDDAQCARPSRLGWACGICLCRIVVLSHTGRRDAGADGACRQTACLSACGLVHIVFRARRRARLHDRRSLFRYRRPVVDQNLWARGRVRRFSR